MNHRAASIALALVALATTAVSFAGPLGGENKTYLISAARYLNVQKDQGTRVTKAMRGLQSHDTSGEDFRDIVETARSVTNEDWDNNYLKTGRTRVPDSYAEIDKNIQRSHDLREASYKAWLEGSKGGDPASAEGANDDFNNSLKAEQKALDDLITVLQVKKR